MPPKLTKWRHIALTDHQPITHHPPQPQQPFLSHKLGSDLFSNACTCLYNETIPASTSFHFNHTHTADNDLNVIPTNKSICIAHEAPITVDTDSNTAFLLFQSQYNPSSSPK